MYTVTERKIVSPERRPPKLSCLGPAPLASFEDLPTDEQNSSDDDRNQRSPPITVTITDHDNDQITSTNSYEIQDLQDSKSNRTLLDVNSPINSPKATKWRGSWAGLFTTAKEKRSPSPKVQQSKRKSFSFFPFKLSSKGKKNSQNSAADLMTLPLSNLDLFRADSPDSLTVIRNEDRCSPSMLSNETICCTPASIEIKNKDKISILDQNESNNSKQNALKSQTLADYEMTDIEIGVSIIESDTDLSIEENRMELNEKSKSREIEKFIIRNYEGKDVVVEDCDCIFSRHSHCSFKTEDEEDDKTYSCDCSQNQSDMDIIADNEETDEIEDCYDKGDDGQVKNFHDINEILTLLNNDELQLNLEFQYRADESFGNNGDITKSRINPKNGQRTTVPKKEMLVSVTEKREKRVGLNLDSSKIERPKSIVPINMENFENFMIQNSVATIEKMHSAKESSDRSTKQKPLNNQSNKFDRLEIRLPGSQFHMTRDKIRRKSNQFIWQEFCEKGLKSPQTMRKRANSCFPQINQELKSPFKDDFNELIPSAENLTPITPIKNLNLDDDDDYQSVAVASDEESRNNEYDKNFDQISLIKKKVSAFNSRLKNQFSFDCTCSCNTSSLTSTLTNFLSATTCTETNLCSTEIMSDDCEATNSLVDCRNNLVDGIIDTNLVEFSEDQPLVTPCDCICHFATKIVTRNKSSEIRRNDIDDDEIKSLIKNDLSSSSTLSSTTTETSPSSRMTRSKTLSSVCSHSTSLSSSKSFTTSPPKSSSSSSSRTTSTGQCCRSQSPSFT
ncbi:hypothetical protein NH340_JMT02976 [Sarcoptes scabiei]|nr:hypothetical protein NH340_JMT02976 [Sarcoptes scabiei]